MHKMEGELWYATVSSWLEGKSTAEQVDALEELSAELLVRADDLRAEMAAAADAPAEEVP